MADETPGRVAATLSGIRADTQSLAQTNSPSWGTVPKIRRVIAGTERLLAAVEDALALHHPKPLYALVESLRGESLCGHSADYDGDAHFEADDGFWYCRDKITGQVCAQCADEDVADLWADWPCATYLAITAALTGTQPSEDGNHG